MPKVSVVMPVYNSQKFVGEAIESILEQTYQDWEMFIINDCSTDESEKVILSYSDDRIHYVRNESNKGFLYGLNYGIDHSKGDYIARLDDDDVCKPDRFEKQVAYLNDNPEVALVGTLNDIIINGKHYDQGTHIALSGPAAKFTELFDNRAFSHSSFMMRRQFLYDHGIKYDTFKQTPDYHMILDICRFGVIATINEKLVSYRIHPAQSTAVRSRKMKETESDKTRCMYIQDLPLEDEDKLILKRGVCRDLKTKPDFENFFRAVDKYAEYCHYDVNKERDKRGGLGLTYMLSTYKHSPFLFRLINNSKYIDYIEYFGIKEYFKLFVKCMIRYSKHYYPPTDSFEKMIERIDLG